MAGEWHHDELLLGSLASERQKVIDIPGDYVESQRFEPAVPPRDSIFVRDQAGPARNAAEDSDTRRTALAATINGRSHHSNGQHFWRHGQLILSSHTSLCG